MRHVYRVWCCFLNWHWPQPAIVSGCHCRARLLYERARAVSPHRRTRTCAHITLSLWVCEHPLRISARPSSPSNESAATTAAGKTGENGDGNTEESSREEGWFRPDFTHQLFEEERIEGFKEGELTIRVLYTPASLDFLVKIQTGNTDDAR